MTLEPDDGRDIADGVAAIYDTAELMLLAKMAGRVGVGAGEDDYRQRQQAEQAQFRREAQSLTGQLMATGGAATAKAVAAAGVRGREVADAELDEVGAPPAPQRDRRQDRRPEIAAQQVKEFTSQLPIVAEQLYLRVVTRINATHIDRTTPAGGLRVDAVQQALDILTARGITGFRDNAGRNWSLATYMEMKSRTLVNQQLIDSHTEQMKARGQNLLVVSSHRNPAPQCQPFEGQVLSLDGTTGTITEPNAAGPGTVTVKIKATLEDARAQGFQHMNCRHAVSSFIPGASRTFTTEPNEEGYKATQQLRAMERAIRETKRRQAVAVTPAAKRQLGAKLRDQQKQAREHIATHDLKRRPRRERIDLGYNIGDIDPKGVTTPKLPKPTPDAPSIVPKPAAASTRLSPDTVDLIERARATLPKDRAGWLDTTLRYPKDKNGAKLIPEKLAGHLTTTMQVGEAIRRDTTRLIGKDKQIAALRAEDRDLVANGKGFSPRRQAIPAEIARRERAIIQDTLADVRSFGGVRQKARIATQPGRGYEAGDQTGIDLLRAAETLYPTDWLRAANTRSDVVIGNSDRAFYRYGGRSGEDIIASMTTDDPYYRGSFSSYAEEVMAHELGHRMEMSIPGLTHLEYAFVRSRSIKDGALEPLTPIFKDPDLADEVGYADEWTNRYAGKSYAEGASDPATEAAEVFQVGIEDTFGREHQNTGGEYDSTGQLQEFVMGVMALL